MYASASPEYAAAYLGSASMAWRKRSILCCTDATLRLFRRDLPFAYSSRVSGFAVVRALTSCLLMRSQPLAARMATARPKAHHFKVRRDRVRFLPSRAGSALSASLSLAGAGLEPGSRAIDSAELPA